MAGPRAIDGRRREATDGTLAGGPEARLATTPSGSQECHAAAGAAAGVVLNWFVLRKTRTNKFVRSTPRFLEENRACHAQTCLGVLRQRLSATGTNWDRHLDGGAGRPSGGKAAEL
jgi:hypothetical protein